MNEQIFFAAYVFGAVLVPIVPAFVLFRYLPSTGEATGTWRGRSVKFSGSFAGFITLVALLFWVRPEADQHYHSWQVDGSLAFTPAEGESEPNVNDVYVRLVPPRLTVLNEGVFSWEVPVMEQHGRLYFPDLQIDLRGYRGVTIPLGRPRGYGSAVGEMTVDKRERRITLPLVTLQSVKQAPPYVPSAAEQPKVIK